MVIPASRSLDINSTDPWLISGELNELTSSHEKFANNKILLDIINIRKC